MRRAVLAVCGVLVFACSSGKDTEPAVGWGLKAESTVVFPACHDTVAVVGEPLRISVRASWVTTACMCKYTTRDNGWTCSDRLRCQSEYEVGARNEVECETLDTEPVEITGIDTDADGCSVETEPSPDAKSMTLVVTCASAAEGTLEMRIHTARGDTSDSRTVRFIENGECPGSDGPPAPDADAPDAEPSD